MNVRIWLFITALPVSDPAQDVKISPEKLENMNKLKALLTASPLKVASPVSPGGNAGNLMKISCTTPTHSLSLGNSSFQPTLTQISSPRTVSSLGSSDVFLCSSSSYGEVRTSSDIILNNHSDNSRSVTLQMDSVDSTTNDQTLYHQNSHNSQSLLNYNCISSKDDSSQDNTSVLHNLLTSGVESSVIDSPTSNCSPLSPEIGVHSSVSSPVLFETNTQSTLIAKSEQLRIEHDEDVKVEEFAWDVVNHEPKKSLKTHRNSNAGTTVVDSEPDSLFDAGSATSNTSEFTFTKFGADVSPIFTFSGEKEKTDTNSTSSVR